MRRYIFVRLVQGIVILFIISVVVFGLARLTGDPSIYFLGEEPTPEERAEIRRSLGLDKPLTTQYWIFVRGAVRGDFGRSIMSRRPVSESIKDRLPNSIKLDVVALFIAFLIGLPLGVLGAARKGSYWDKLARVIAGLGQSIPVFWLGIVLIMVFSVHLRLLPTSGMVGWKSYIMPGFCLGIFMMAGILRLLRANMLDVLDSEFIKMARIKGVSERMVIWHHALRNSLLAVVSFAGLYAAILIGGAIAVETVFAWPGFGRLAYESIMGRDYPVIQGVVLTSAVIIILANLATDIIYAYLDPRIRYTT